MKKALSVFLFVVLAISLFGCVDKENTSSKKPVTADISSTESKLYKNDFGESTYVDDSSSETATIDDTASNEKKQKSQANIDDEYKNADVKPSDIKNPTGIYSAGRKNNTGSNWNLTLVNPWNTLDLNYSVKLKNVDSRFGSGMQFDARAVKYLNDMCSAAQNDGVSLQVISSFRTYDYQQMLYQNEVNEYKSLHPGCSENEALKGAATEVARPGTSEHNLGLAVDFNSVEQSFENTAAYTWLRKHSTEYGFIMRYAKEKQKYTGVIYEPWHYRYVGVDLAKKIEDSGLCLEEYLKKYGQ